MGTGMDIEIVNQTEVVYVAIGNSSDFLAVYRFEKNLSNMWTSQVLYRSLASEIGSKKN